jgi:hypothetical protein
MPSADLASCAEHALVVAVARGIKATLSGSQALDERLPNRTEGQESMSIVLQSSSMLTSVLLAFQYPAALDSLPNSMPASSLPRTEHRRARERRRGDNATSARQGTLQRPSVRIVLVGHTMHLVPSTEATSPSAHAADKRREQWMSPSEQVERRGRLVHAAWPGAVAT